MAAEAIEHWTELKTRPLHDKFGIEVIDFDLGRALSTDEAQRIVELADRHLILLFRGQEVSEEQQVAFSQALGPVIPPVEAAFASTRNPMILRLGNVDMAGNKLADDAPATKYNDAAEDWHSDGSFKAKPNYLTTLHGLEIPPERGETWYASMVAVYEALSDDTKALIADKAMYHPYPSQNNKVKGWEATKFEPAIHPLVRELPDGQKALFLAHPTSGGKILGMDPEESDRLTRELMAFATSGPFTYQHKWQHSDFLIWNNRGLIHSARGWDRAKYRRLLQRTELATAHEFT